MPAQRLSKWIGEHPSTFYPSLVHHPITPEPRTSKRDSYFILLPSNFFSARPAFRPFDRRIHPFVEMLVYGGQSKIQSLRSGERRESSFEPTFHPSYFCLHPFPSPVTAISSPRSPIQHSTFNIRNLPFCFTRYSSFSLLKTEILKSAFLPTAPHSVNYVHFAQDYTACCYKIDTKGIFFAQWACAHQSLCVEFTACATWIPRTT